MAVEYNSVLKADTGDSTTTSKRDLADEEIGWEDPSSQVTPLRLVFVTEEDPIYVIEFFREFFSEYPSSVVKPVAITIDRAFHEPLWRTLKRLLGLYGVLGTLRQSVRFLSALSRGDTIAKLSESVGIPLVSTSSVNRPDYIAQIRELRPDLIVSVASPEIFSPELLRSARLGCLNLHSGRLPAYRGMLPSFWQMLNGENAVTVTVHRMVRKLDAGEVVAERTVPLLPGDSLDRVIRQAKREGARLLVEVLRTLRHGPLRGIPLDMREARYYPFPRAADVRKFRARGFSLL